MKIIILTSYVQTRASLTNLARNRRIGNDVI